MQKNGCLEACFALSDCLVKHESVNSQKNKKVKWSKSWGYFRSEPSKNKENHRTIVVICVFDSSPWYITYVDI
jgi:hypothetical protein